MPIIQPKTSLGPLGRNKKGESLPRLSNLKTSFNFANSKDLTEQIKSGNKAIRKVYVKQFATYAGQRLVPHGYVNSLKDLRLATHLTFELKTDEYFGEDMFQIFKSLPYVRSLVIIIKRDRTLDACVLKKLGDGLRRLKSLKYFSIKIDECKKNTLRALKSSLRYLKPSSVLALDFSKSESLNDEILKNFFDDVGTPKKLSKFALSIANCYNVTGCGLDAIISFIQSQRRLSGLYLDLLSFRPVEDSGLVNLFESLKQLPKLSSLNLNLSNLVSLSSKSIKTLSNSLSSFEFLSRLTLTMSLCSKIDENALNIILANLKLNKNMQNLSLDFRRCAGLAYPGLNILTSSIKEMKFLSKLALDVSRGEAVNDNILKDLAGSLEDRRLLSTINLNVSHCISVTTQGLARFTKLTNFKSSLSCNNCPFVDVKKLNKWIKAKKEA